MPPLNLIIKSVNPIDTGTLVISAEQEEIQRVLDLIGEQQADRLQGLFTPVHVIPEK